MTNMIVRDAIAEAGSIRKLLIALAAHADNVRESYERQGFHKDHVGPWATAANALLVAAAKVEV